MFQFQMPGVNPNILGQQQQQQQGGLNGQGGQIKVIGNYQYDLKHCLGEGAYGKVFEGIDNRTNQKVAIKKLDIRQFQNDTYLRKSIISEIEILKRFDHKNIVKFIDLITTTRSFYIITEYCKDGDLRLLIQSKKITEPQALRVIRDIVEGFKELVKHNVTHRDLKPANILMHEGVFKIADFGFAKYVDYSSSQMLRSCVGSPLYMAPQILARNAYGLKSDVWSIGVILHEMLFQDVPWKARDERELLNNITKNPYKPRKNSKLMNLTDSILTRTLVNEEKDRVSWEELFKMFQTYDTANLVSPFNNGNNNSNNQNVFPISVQNKENNPSRPATVMVPVAAGGQGIINNLNPNNKLKKSIFDNPGISGQQRQATGLQRQQSSSLDGKQIFQLLNTKRQDISFKHFICIDLSSKAKRNKLQIDNSQLIYEKLLMCLTAQVQSDSALLSYELREQESINQDLFKSTKELKALAATIRKDAEFYQQFSEEILSDLQNGNILEYLKTDKEVMFLLNTSQNEGFKDLIDQDKPRVDSQILSYAQTIISQLLNKTQKNIQYKLNQQPQAQQAQDLEIFRQQIVTAEYLQDLIETRKKLQRGESIQFDSLHLLKSEIASIHVHLDRAFSRMPKFSFGIL